ncbi:hypothetical protein [Chryseobacterium scophthalmum]|uniref:hypothetical protein n=1 Tax=Chryseobacterium scophthalmum TaxID=59733 RepID=UPI000C9DEF55|nr:hypothetical protein [Chryseobacterium scophthalmum]
MATLKKLMTLMSKEGVSNQRAEIISAFTHGRTASAKNLNPQEIDTLCEFYERNSTEKLNKKRKRVIAAIFGMFKKMNKNVTTEYVKSIACRASNYERFNDIPSSRLDSLYAAFLKAQKDLNFAGRMVEGYISEQQHYN